MTLIFVNSAGASITGTGNINLSPPTSGPYAGIVMATDGSPSAITLTGGGSQVITGVMDLPGAYLKYAGVSSSSGGNAGCTQIIADSVVFSGNSQVGNSCASMTGVKKFGAANSATLSN
ncbi:MAG: hypothetical protein KGL46_10535 [Hyphomicrobiales bacterium]|nr:hypothetical protein [Hyphomicrobiales bacterium]